MYSYAYAYIFRVKMQTFEQTSEKQSSKFCITEQKPCILTTKYRSFFACTSHLRQENYLCSVGKLKTLKPKKTPTLFYFLVPIFYAPVPLRFHIV